MKKLLILFCFLFSFTLNAAWVSDPNFVRHPTGLILPPTINKNISVDSLKDVDIQLPSKFDWRDKGLTPVHNQQCGDCWAQATVGVFENVLKLTGINDLLAPQYLISCNKLNYSCDGGFAAFDMYLAPAGAVAESAFPYAGADEACQDGLTFGENVSSWAFITDGNSLPSVDSIKKAIYMYGPVWAGVAADDTFMSYQNGVYDSNTSSELNHAIVLTGWNDKTGSWTLRNSWGPWGETGYMRIKYGTDLVGTAAAYIKFRMSPNPKVPFMIYNIR